MFANFEHLIRVYGAVAIFLGAALEGEAAVTTGGFLAHRNLVDPYVAAAAAFGGSFAADQLVFFVARYHRENKYIERVRQRPAFARAIGFIERRPVMFCTVFRFIYGMRIAGPIAIGVSKVPARRFIILNAMSAAVWAAVFTYIGFRFGNAFELLVARIASDPWTIAAAVLVVCGIAGFIFIRHRRMARHSSGGNL
ncbi:DedA family protein [Sphingomonas paeninsulae]|jgi:membrane protein DedA with SNARE-associated domain|uniref:DedA family protein n=1 Tax=Sphingomonas paeninsulae TaxID=2319844 RepID=A0A494TBJ9_SPHPE|nr:DedA family protein [Sphingomonas paeninsulae]AYJ86819.1 DedA family protein [Sphingomonas paeninsulae]